MNDGRWLYLNARMLLAGCMALAIAFSAGCAEEDDDGKKGGGGTIITPQPIPPIPTARPTLAGMTVTIDVSGGDAPIGSQADPGSGGNVSIYATAGALLQDDGRSEPPVDKDFIPTSALADNTVTFAELIAVDPQNVVQTSEFTYIDIDGADFHLPAGATLDLSGATTAGVGIRCFGADDRIRIDGIVRGASANGGVAVLLISHADAGTAISVSGTIDTRGSSTSPDSGPMILFAEWGDVVVRGTLDASGAAGSMEGGNGGNVEIYAAQGDAVLANGIWQSNGGNNGGGNFTGDGGGIQFYAEEAPEFAWGLRANGGDSDSTAGYAGSANGGVWKTTNFFVPMEFNGGISTGSDGGEGGTFRFEGAEMSGVIAGNLDGGVGNDSGGFGGQVYVVSGRITAIAVDVSMNGGDAPPGNGGDGGFCQVFCNGLEMINVLSDVEARGGNGSQGGFGGGAVLVGDGVLLNANLDADVSGGNSTSSGGGGGGVAGIDNFSLLGTTLEEVNLTVVANGGTGIPGGNGGFIFIDPSGSNNNNVTANITADGGNGTGAAAPGNGGNGGRLDASNSEGSDAWSMNLTLTGSMNGGTSSGANGGTGGRVVLNAPGVGGWYTVSTPGVFSMRGGDNLAAGAGGNGGGFRAQTGIGKRFVSDMLNVDARGGDSAQGNGGAGASFGRTISYTGLELYIGGELAINGGLIDISGGTGSTSGGQGLGGSGGEARIYTFFGDINWGATLNVNGGNGAGGGGGSVNSESVEFNTDFDDDGLAGLINISGTVRANGGSCTGATGNGGSSGYLWINTLSISGVSGGDILIGGTLESMGGNAGTAGGDGGDSPGIEISSGGTSIEISGTVRQTGGDGSFAGSVSGPQVGTLAVTDVLISGTIEAIAGQGSSLGGNSGTIEIGSPSFGVPAATITVVAGAVIRNVAGDGAIRGGGATGFIELDAQGSGGANVSVATGATVEVLDSAGNPVPGNVTID